MTQRAGVIGHPVAHSVSPAMFEAAFRAAGIDATYEAWDTPPDTLEGRINALRGAGFLGANVTIPHKEAVAPLLDVLEGPAQQTGAVNCIVHRDGKLIGHNTDLVGFARALREDAQFDPRGKSTMLLGSGGAARAVALALIEGGAGVIYVVARQPRKIDRMVVDLKPLTRTGTTITWAYWGDGSYLRSLQQADLVVNCTPIGMKGGGANGTPALDPKWLRKDALVFDLVYNPQETPTVRAVKEHGARAIAGLPMLVYQAAEAFRLWTGIDPDTKVMIEAARGALAA